MPPAAGSHRRHRRSPPARAGGDQPMYRCKEPIYRGVPRRTPNDATTLDTWWHRVSSPLSRPETAILPRFGRVVRGEGIGRGWRGAYCWLGEGAGARPGRCGRALSGDPSRRYPRGDRCPHLLPPRPTPRDQPRRAGRAGRVERHRATRGVDPVRHPLRSGRASDHDGRRDGLLRPRFTLLRAGAGVAAADPRAALLRPRTGRHLPDRHRAARRHHRAGAALVRLRPLCHRDGARLHDRAADRRTTRRARGHPHRVSRRRGDRPDRRRPHPADRPPR